MQREEGGECASSDTDILESAYKANGGHTPPTHSPVILPVFSIYSTLFSSNFTESVPVTGVWVRPGALSGVLKGYWSASELFNYQKILKLIC